MTLPGDSKTFLSCGEDMTVRCYDLRVRQTSHDHNSREASGSQIKTHIRKSN